MRGRSKIALIILAILVSLYSVDRLTNLALDGTIRKSLFRFSRMYTGKVKSNVLVFGNSRGVDGFYEPYARAHYSADVSNLSFNGMPFQASVILMKDAIDICRPKKVLLEVSSLFIADELREELGEYNLYTPYSARLDSFYHQNYPRIFYTDRIFLTYRYNTELFLRTLYYRNRWDTTWINRNVIPKELRETAVTLPAIHLTLPEKNLRLLEETLNYARKSNVEAALFLSPYYPAYYRKFSNIDSIIHTIQSATASRVYNYATLPMNETDFANFVHPNIHCALKVVDAMKKEGLLE